MAMIDDLKARFPNIEPATIDEYFPLFQDNYTCYYGAKYGSNSCDDEIILNLMAHLITNADNMADSGGMAQYTVQSESVDGVSTSFAGMQNISVEDGFFYSTIYGQTYKMLIQKNSGGFFV